MALINCPECGKEASDKAAACPNCGYGIREHFEAQQRELAAKERQKLLEIEKQEAEKKANIEREKRIKDIQLPKKPSKKEYTIAGILCGIFALIGVGITVDAGNGFGLFITIVFAWLAMYCVKWYTEALEKYENARKNPDEYKRAVAEADVRRESEKEEVRKRLEEIESKRLEEKKGKTNNAPFCPKCGSTYISTVNRGYSIVWGFIGSGNAMNVCQKCGHKWKPGA